MKDNIMITVGIDISDHYSKICIVDEVDGQIEVVEETRIRTTPDAVTQYFSWRGPMLVAMEVGAHSAWMSRIISELGHEVVVANARKLRFIFANDQKNDDIDAEMLARVARMDPALLSPLEHRDEKDAQVMALVRSRDALVRSRTALVNHVRGTVKAHGQRLRGCATARFHKLSSDVPEELASALRPVMDAIAVQSEMIREMEREIEVVAQESYPETEILRQIAGIGALIALVFVLVIQDPWRFRRNRSVGAYVGLVPKRDQSGERDPQLSIAKSGDPYLRRLLVGAAHYILGPFGPDSDLRRYGLRIAEKGGKRAKKRAAVAVARKLSVLMLSLLKSKAEYQPLRREEGGKAA